MRIVVIGAGVGGMVAALRLAKAGHAVLVLEQNERIGGKLNVWEPDAPGAGRFRFDTGPHVLTMPWTIEELFRDLGFAFKGYMFRRFRKLGITGPAARFSKRTAQEARMVVGLWGVPNPSRKVAGLERGMREAVRQ